MAEKKTGGGAWKKYALIGGAIFIFVIAALVIYFLFFMPSLFEVDEVGNLGAPQIPELFLRLGVIIGVFTVGLIFIVAVVFVIYEMFFKKKELHIINEHHKVITEATSLNPVKTLGRIIMTGKGKIQNYPIGKIIGHTQVPVSFERLVYIDGNGRVDEEKSETIKDYKKRLKQAVNEGRDVYDFFAFITKKGVYALPIFNLFETPKIFACYPSERSPDLVGDIEVYDVGTWKISGVNIFVPASRSKEPKTTIKEMEGQLFPIAYMSLIDYLGLVAQRGIEGDTSMQKWLQAKASTVNIKERDD